MPPESTIPDVDQEQSTDAVSEPAEDFSPPAAMTKPSPLQRVPPLARPAADNPAQRHQDVYTGVDKAAKAEFDRQHPFQPSSWQPATPNSVYREAIRQSDADARDQAAVDRAAHTDALKAQNADREAQMRSSGQRFYTDPYGQIQPILEAGTNRPLYTPSARREQGVNPKTNEPAWVTMDRYGQKQYHRPTLIANPDTTDDKLYYDFGNGQQVAAGRIDDLAKSPDFHVARAAMQAQHKQRAAAWKEAIAPMQADVGAADVQFREAEQRQSELKALSEDYEKRSDAILGDPRYNEMTGGVLGTQIGAKPSAASRTLQASYASLQAQKETADKQLAELTARLKPGGEFQKNRRRAQLELAIAKLRALHERYSDQADERQAILRHLGKDEEKDPTFGSIQQAMRMYDAMINNYSDILHGQPVRKADDSSSVQRPQ